MLPVLFRRQLRLIITEAVTTDIPTEGITTDITITGTTIGTGPGAEVITAIGKPDCCPPSLERFKETCSRSKRRRRYLKIKSATGRIRRGERECRAFGASLGVD